MSEDLKRTPGGGFDPLTREECEDLMEKSTYSNRDGFRVTERTPYEWVYVLKP